MPLKHRTETFLIAVLTCAILLTSILVASLPSLPQGFIPWAILLVITSLYPIVLSPLFKTDRADYEFRWLHWVPALLVLLWMMFDGIGYYWPSLHFLKDAFIWAWSLPLVGMALLGIIAFSLKVLRQWSKRIVIMLGLFIPFACIALWSSAGAHLENSVRALIWENKGMQKISALAIPKTTIIQSSSSSISEVAMEQSSTNSIKSSSLSPEENKWKSYLFAYKKQSSQISQITSSKTSAAAIIKSSSKQSSKAPVLIGQSSSAPKTLPKSGAEYAFIALTLLALYCSSLHKKYSFAV